MRDVIGASAGWLARAIRSKQISSVEVVRAHLEHIHTVNPRLNAVVFATAESAIKEARTADRRNKRKNALGPLHGVPFTAKDIFNTAGLPTTAGLRMLRTNVPDHDATVVARMRRAGAILPDSRNVTYYIYTRPVPQLGHDLIGASLLFFLPAVAVPSPGDAEWVLICGPVGASGLHTAHVGGPERRGESRRF